MMDDEYIDSFGNPYKYADIIDIKRRPQDELVCPKCDSPNVKSFFSDCVSGYAAWWRAQCQECKAIVEWGYGEG